MRLGDLIKKYREDNKLSQREFARNCGLSNSLISILEMGKNPQTGKPMEPDLRTYRRLAYGMGMTEKELLDELRPDGLARISPIKVRGPHKVKYTVPGLRVKGNTNNVNAFEVKLVGSSNRQTLPGGAGKIIVVDADPELHSVLKLWKDARPEKKKDIVRIVKAITEEE